MFEAFKHRVVMDPDYADKTWNILEHAIQEIYNHNARNIESFEALYRFFLMILIIYSWILFSSVVIMLYTYLAMIRILLVF